MKSITSRPACIVALLATLSVPVFGDAIAVDGTIYHEFDFGVAPSAALSCGPANVNPCTATTNPVAEGNSTSPWTFTGAATLTVLDLGDIGDRFNVFDNSNLLGSTSETSGSGNPCGPPGTLDIACGLTHLGSTGFSSATFQLPAGAHSITFSIIANASGTTFGQAVFLVGPPAVPATSSIFVVDGARVEAFTNTGVYVSQFAINGAGRFPNGAAGMAIDAIGDFFLTDIGNKNVSEFNSSGGFVRSFGSYGSGDGQFLNGIGGIAIDGSGNVLVVDAGNHRVQKFSNTGTYLSQFGTVGSGPGRFQRPSAIALNAVLPPSSVTIADPPSSNIWIVDGGRVEQFTNGGVFVSQFAINGAGRFPNGAAGMAIDANGNFFLTDIGNKNISEFSSGGVFLMSFGSYGTSNGQFLNGIGGIAIGQLSDDAWVSDAGNFRVQKFLENGTFLQTIGAHGSGSGQFQSPGAIAIQGGLTPCLATLPSNFCSGVQ